MKKRYRIRKRSPLWWIVNAAKYAAGIAAFYTILIIAMSRG